MQTAENKISEDFEKRISTSGVPRLPDFLTRSLLIYSIASHLIPQTTYFTYYQIKEK